VIRTLRSGDHGSDVVVLGREASSENVLIQCKQTKADVLDSDVCVREVEGARPFYEAALDVKFSRRVLHTTARKFSRRTQHAAQITGVEIHACDSLDALIRAHHGTHAQRRRV
jgi:hypothetical protein